MFDKLLLIFDVSGFPPRWSCGLWSSLHGWTHIIADVLTALAYFAIPLTLAVFVSKRRDVPFSWLLWLFCAFIFSCGSVHLIEATIFWHPWYRLSAVAKVLTAGFSLMTVVALIKVLPEALKLPGMADVNRRLEVEVEERKRVNQTLALKNRELEDFAYIVSHDLQEPLRAISSFSGLLKGDLGENLPDVARDDLTHILNSTERMQQMVKDLLRLSRAGRDELKKELTPLQECVDDAIGQMELRIASSEARITTCGLPTMTVDRRLITQLFQNLISNAIKFTKDSQRPTIEITYDGNGVFGVKDSGIGIDPAYAKTIFNPFKRLHARDAYEGTGIGLSICRKAVERHGGRIWVESQPGSGSHFLFTLSPGSKDD